MSSRTKSWNPGPCSAQVSIALSLAAALLGSVGCEDRSFECSQSSECAGEDSSGICQVATGYCSFPAADCPSGQRYGEQTSDDLAQTCVPLDAVPTLQIRSPSFGQSFGSADQVSIVVTGSGFELGSEPSTAPAVARVRVMLDDERIDITSGDIADGVVVTELTVPTTAGAHYLGAQVFHDDDTAFANPEASDRRLFWIDDGRPQVAITTPWPGAILETGTPPVDIEIEVLNFALASPDTAPVAGQGHAHIYYDASFPSCADDVACDTSYFAVVSLDAGGGPPSSGRQTAQLPDATEGPATLTAVLREGDHSPLRDPSGSLVTQGISIQRVEPE